MIFILRYITWHSLDLFLKDCIVLTHPSNCAKSVSFTLEGLLQASKIVLLHSTNSCSMRLAWWSYSCYLSFIYKVVSYLHWWLVYCYTVLHRGHLIWWLKFDFQFLKLRTWWLVLWHQLCSLCYLKRKCWWIFWKWF